MLDLRTKRVIARLNQYDLAIRSGIPQPTCSLMENGYRVPNEDERKALIEEVKQVNPRCTFPTILIGGRVIVGFKEDEIREALGLS